MKKIAVFASGSGTNFQAINDAIKDGKLEAQIGLLVCDRKGAMCIKRAESENIPTFVFTAKEYQDKTSYEEAILHRLHEQEIEFIVLAGYMRLIGHTLLNAYRGRIVNIHPSLLPAFQGKDAIGQALAAKAAMTGVTVHFVDEGMDTGPVIDQREVVIDEGDTKEMLEAKVHDIEHKLYPAVLQRLFKSEDASI
ncbi:phosphoribosylglycinamide formyltransferase [Niallia oryzisoli]|uniref:phosphoribosylglycinamide formyltransferase n=1 Tax=Niallia oryzisoli TaxID=1737571 RepID=UPI0037366625